MVTCVVDTRQGDGGARIVRATVFERLGDEGMSPSIEYWHGEAADHRALADKILDPDGGDTMILAGKRVPRSRSRITASALPIAARQFRRSRGRVR
jgi:hypothetical protein